MGYKKRGNCGKKLIYGDNFIEITYKDKQGNRLYPNTYVIDKGKALCYPTQILDGGIKLRIIPIDDLEILK